MCLHLTLNTEENTANEDIICYKLVSYDNTNFFTFYRNFSIEIGKTYNSELCCIKNTVDIGLHSFLLYTDAFSMLEMCYPTPNIFIVKCVIPRGSKYYIGTFCSLIAFASNCITYSEIINE